MGNWQGKENQRLRQDRSRHPGHFQLHHPEMESTGQQLHISRLRATIHRRGSKKKSRFPPEGQTSPELASSDLSVCPSHLFSAVQRLEHGTEKPGLVSKPPEAESSSAIQEHPKHRDKDCSQGPIGLSARHSSLDSASGGRARRCRGGSAAGAPRARRSVFACVHHLQQSPNRRDQAQRAGNGQKTHPLPPLSSGRWHS